MGVRIGKIGKVYFLLYGVDLVIGKFIFEFVELFDKGMVMMFVIVNILFLG